MPCDNCKIMVIIIYHLFLLPGNCGQLESQDVNFQIIKLMTIIVTIIKNALVITVFDLIS